jgi:hypothetical protein
MHGGSTLGAVYRHPVNAGLSLFHQIAQHRFAEILPAAQGELFDFTQRNVFTGWFVREYLVNGGFGLRHQAGFQFVLVHWRSFLFVFAASLPFL